MADSIGTGGIIGIAVGASALTALVMSLVYGAQVKPLFSAGPRPVGFLEYFSIVNWFKILYYFLPYALFLFGVVYDGLLRKIIFFPSGFIGLANVYLNSMLSYLVTKTSSDDLDICGIPGMTKWGSGIAPQNILFTSTVLSYIASYVSASQTNSAYSGAAWGGMFAVWALQVGAYYSNSCYTNRSVAGWVFPVLGSITPPLYALFGGMLVGGGSGALISKYVGGNVGTGISSDAKQSLTSSGPAMGSTAGATGAGKCSSTDSDDQFVCEAYKNGELVTSTIVE